MNLVRLLRQRDKEISEQSRAWFNDPANVRILESISRQTVQFRNVENSEAVREELRIELNRILLNIELS